MTKQAKVLRFPKHVARRWDSGAPSSLLGSWSSYDTPIDADIREQIVALRARCRESAQNNDHARQFLRLIEANVAGPMGFSVQSRAVTASGKPDRAAIDAIESAWAHQSKRGQWDVTGQLTRAQFDRQILRTVAVDGEALIRIYGGWDNTYGIAAQAIDPALLDHNLNAELANGNAIRMGVEMDQYRRPIAYHLHKAPSALTRSYSKSERERVPASQMIHVYLPEWVMQTRGVPWMSTSLIRLQMLSGYEDAAITAARSAAVKSAAYVQSTDAPPGTGPTGEEDEDTGALNQVLEPGLAEILPYGWDLKPIDWSWPNIEHGAFVKEVLRGVAAGLGVGYNSIATDLEGVNFSSLRSGALAERDTWMTLQQWYIDWVVHPIFDRWLSASIGRGLISRPSGRPLDPMRLTSLQKVTILGRRWAWVDPHRDLLAAELAVRLRTRSISDIIREQGRDPDDVWAELAADQERLRELGLTPEQILEAVPEQPDPVIDDEN